MEYVPHEGVAVVEVGLHVTADIVVDVAVYGGNRGVRVADGPRDGKYRPPFEVYVGQVVLRHELVHFDPEVTAPELPEADEP